MVDSSWGIGSVVSLAQQSLSRVAHGKPVSSVLFGTADDPCRCVLIGYYNRHLSARHDMSASPGHRAFNWGNCHDS